MMNERSEKNWHQKITRDAGQCWENECDIFLKGVFQKTKEKLERAGIKLIRNLKYLDNFDETIEVVCRETSVNGIKVLTKNSLRKIVQEARMALDGSPPISIDHCLAPNP